MEGFLPYNSINWKNKKGKGSILPLTPPKLHGIMMGIWIMIMGVGAILANIFSKLAIGITTSTSPLETNLHFFKSFLILASLALVAEMVLSSITPFLNKLIKEKNQ